MFCLVSLKKIWWIWRLTLPNLSFLQPFARYKSLNSTRVANWKPHSEKLLLHVEHANILRIRFSIQRFVEWSFPIFIFQEGYFIVRPSSKKDSKTPYAVTLWNKAQVVNFYIRRRPDGLFATGDQQDGGKTFSTVSELVTFYHRNMLVIGNKSNQLLLKGSPKFL